LGQKLRLPQNLCQFESFEAKRCFVALGFALTSSYTTETCIGGIDQVAFLCKSLLATSSHFLHTFLEKFLDLLQHPE